MKPPVARKLAVRHTKRVCLTASFLATAGFKFKIFQNACTVYKHAHLNTLLLLHSAVSQLVKMPLKGEVGGHALKSHGNYIVDHVKIMEKSRNCVFEFLWESCNPFVIKMLSAYYVCCSNFNALHITCGVSVFCP